MTVSSERKPHRSPEEQVADLQAKIASIEARAERKRARANPTVKQAIVAVRALDKGVAVATDPEMKEALLGARSAIAAVVATTGVVLKAKRLEPSTESASAPRKGGARAKREVAKA